MDYQNLMNRAKEVSNNAYSKYSHFSVGACVLCKDGKYYEGCNFENSSYGLSICAERNAIGSAIAAGEKEILAVAVYSPNCNDCIPCGACLQVISEFSSEYGIDIITQGEDDLIIRNFNDLMPRRFRL